MKPISKIYGPLAYFKGPQGMLVMNCKLIGPVCHQSIQQVKKLVKRLNALATTAVKLTVSGIVDERQGGGWERRAHCIHKDGHYWVVGQQIQCYKLG